MAILLWLAYTVVMFSGILVYRSIFGSFFRGDTLVIGISLLLVSLYAIHHIYKHIPDGPVTEEMIDRTLPRD